MRITHKQLRNLIKESIKRRLTMRQLEDEFPEAYDDYWEEVSLSVHGTEDEDDEPPMLLDITVLDDGRLTGVVDNDYRSTLVYNPTRPKGFRWLAGSGNNLSVRENKYLKEATRSLSNLRNDLIESSNGDSEDLGKMKTLLDKLRELDSSLIREVSHYDDLDEPLLEKHLWDAHMSLLKARKILKNRLGIT